MNPTSESQHAPKRSMTAGRNWLLTPAASGAYLAVFLSARNEAATPKVSAEEGRALSAPPAAGQATAVSKNMWRPGPR